MPDTSIPTTPLTPKLPPTSTCLAGPSKPVLRKTSFEGVVRQLTDLAVTISTDESTRNTAARTLSGSQALATTEEEKVVNLQVKYDIRS